MTGQEIVSYDKAWADQAAQYTAQEKITGGTFLSVRGGTMSIGEEQMPGNQVCVIILDAVKENTYYAGAYDPENAAAPTCYAFGRGVEDMAPHPSMEAHPDYFVPQSSDCASCQWNVYGSADKGKGKACQNRRRLALIPAGYYQTKRGSRDFDLEIFSDPKHFQTADMAYIKLSVGSVKEFSKYVNAIAGSMNRPPHGVITRMWVEPDPKWQWLCKFETIEQVPDELAQIVMARHAEAERAVIQGYSPPEAREPAHQGSLRGLRGRR